jgi:hypothetical protein
MILIFVIFIFRPLAEPISLRTALFRQWGVVAFEPQRILQRTFHPVRIMTAVFAIRMPH